MDKMASTPMAKHARALYKAVEIGKILEDERDLIASFISYTSVKKGGKGISDSRKASIVLALLALRDYMEVGYETVDTDQVYTAVERYKEQTNHIEGTQQLYLVTFKQFLTWLVKTERNETLKQAAVSEIGTQMPIALKSEKDILTGDELEKIFKAMKNVRDRTFIEVLYDSMGRINEICRLQWHQIEFNDTYAVITLKSKTNKPRKIPLYTSHATLKQWKYQHPNQANPEDYVFFGRAGVKVPMKYGNTLTMVKTAAKRAGIIKNVTPHTFRHTRITDLLRMGIPEQTIKMLAWGTVTTDMLKVYAHLTPQDSVNDMNKWMGIEPNQKIQPLADIVTPAKCPRCGGISSKLNPYCPLCGSAMVDKVADAFNFMQKQLEQEDAYQECVRRYAQLEDEIRREYGEMRGEKRK